MTETIWGSTKKPAASDSLASKMASLNLDGTLYVGYPIIGTAEGPFSVDALWLSPTHGLVAFSLVEGRNLSNYQEIQDEYATKLQSKLLQYRKLTKNRQLAFDIGVVTYAPGVTNTALVASDEFPVANEQTLGDVLEKFKLDDRAIFPLLTGTIQSVSNIRTAKRRREVSDTSRGGKLRKLEETIATLDTQQGAAVIETVEGVQRIRGLAGSGKTIVLALKVAYLHAQHPDWKIAVTFNTRSLKGQFERFISNFVIEQTSDEPDWERIDIVNAWGAPGGDSRDGIYYKFCKEHELEYYDFRSAEAKFGEGKGFAGACEKAIAEARAPKHIYDVILIDEAQDFSPYFFRLSYAFLKEPKRLVYAYDELQSLTDNSLPSPEELFGTKADGTPLVTFEAPAQGKPRQDIILERCYRNSRPILATAHALGFGIYRERGLIQMFDQKDLWLDIGYDVMDGVLDEGADVSLARLPRTSPVFLESHSPVADLIRFESFQTADEQDKFLVDSIAYNIKEDELHPEDIVVINPNPLKTRRAVANARARLFELEIQNSLAGVSNSPDVFFEPGSVTFTGVFRAKGNEAAMTYVINAQDCYETFFPGDLARVRNQLFTAITRSKAWVRVVGIGPNMDKLKQEFEKLVANDFQLNFRYPTEEERRQLRIVNRDMTTTERRTIRRRLGGLAEVLSSLEAGEIQPGDLPEELRNRLLKALRGRKK
jgi:superfamily I DNA and RNA helicase